MVLIYKDLEGLIKVNIDFYEKPAVIELDNGDNLTHITINGEYLDGNRDDASSLMKWLNCINKELEDIIWEWETGNDNFDLIDTRLQLLH